MLKEAIFLVADFIKKNLSPNRLEGFDIDAIRDLTDFEPKEVSCSHLIINDDQSMKN